MAPTSYRSIPVSGNTLHIDCRPGQRRPHTCKVTRNFAHGIKPSPTRCCFDAAVAAAVCLEIPERPLHFIRLERGDDFEIDKDVVYRAFVLDVDAARNADGSAWAVPIIQCERRLGVVYVEIDKDIGMDSDVIVELRGIADVSNDPDFPENLDRFF